MYLDLSYFCAGDIKWYVCRLKVEIMEVVVDFEKYYGDV